MLLNDQHWALEMKKVTFLDTEKKYGREGTKTAICRWPCQFATGLDAPAGYIQGAFEHLEASVPVNKTYFRETSSVVASSS